ncbi:nucleotide exchange factor GrpE [Carboxylicivirga linearis]|uniref:Protein GrpE n=1 Tax=Carboxylicivirga linearis TaxID=1628157 RepID=A0ABS5JRE8_9BACT|nr:nucleotide exchange factor GrpE [Carboxylicivirga linearis]MBS2097066.1 nucleotide exchange factor GrpE [Carboxylicivirga linearis]
MVKKSSKKQDAEKAKEVEETVEPTNEQAQETEETVEENTTDDVEETKEDESPEQSEEEKLAEKVNELNDKYVRLSAEFDNYRRRTLKEKMELSKSAGEGLLLSLLPVVDDFDRALAHIDEAKDIDALKEGIKLIYNKFNEYLKQQGIKEIEAKEKDFDTDLHEAVTKIPAPTEDMKGKVIDCIEKGYTLNEKVIRFSKVVVGE